MRFQLLAPFLCLLLAACTQVDPIAARTQVTLRIATTDGELLAQMDALRVAVRLDEGAQWRDTISKTFAASGLHWPVEVPVTPRVPDDSNKQFEVVVDALRAGDAIAQTRVIARFVEGERRLQDLELYLCRNDEGIAICADASCVGLNCGVCSKSGACDLVSMSEGTREPSTAGEMDAGAEPDAAAQEDGGDAALVFASDATLTMEDGEAGPVAPAEYALGVSGTSCPTNLEQSLACEGHASRKILKCQAGSWQVLQTCSMSERCDSRVGTEQGTCASIPAACLGKSAGEICDGLVRLECGLDLVTVNQRACGEHLHCEGSPNAHCACDTGYQDDGHGGCSNPDNCPAGACSGGKCIDGLSDFSCDCNSGFAGTGTKKCTAVLYCPKDACTPGGTCNDTMNWSCQCNSGYAGTGTQACSNPNDCPTNRCLAPNAVCKDLVGTYDCQCNPGFSGPDCVNDICAANTCKNGGTCSRTGTLCACATGFSGTNCQTDVCNPNPCQHGGTCSRGTTVSCTCTGTGYQGGRCEVAVDPCSGTTNACGGSCMTALAHQPNESCSNGLLGACARTGKYICQGTTTTVCNAPSVAAGAEVCGDGVDNDCDGSVDEADASNATVWYQDCDGDNYSSLTEALILAKTGVVSACAKPEPASGCSGGWTSIRPQAPQTGVPPVNWDCDDTSVAYNPGITIFDVPPAGRTRVDRNCDNIDQKANAIGVPNALNAEWGPATAFLCDASMTCTACGVGPSGERLGAQWLDASGNPTSVQPRCSTSLTDTFGWRDTYAIVGGTCPNGTWSRSGLSGAVQQCL